MDWDVGGDCCVEMVRPGALQRGFHSRVPCEQQRVKCSKVACIRGVVVGSKERLPVVRSRGCRVVCSTGFDWKPIEESFKRKVAWRSSPLSSWKISQEDVTKIVHAIQANALAIYSTVLGLVGFRLSMTLGMGWTIVGACMLTSFVGYALCIRQVIAQENEKGVSSKLGLGKILLQAQECAFQSYSYRTEAASGSKSTALMLVSSLFEPSPVYLLLNCWAVYAIGQCVIYKAFGGGVVGMLFCNFLDCFHL